MPSAIPSFLGTKNGKAVPEEIISVGDGFKIIFLQPLRGQFNLAYLKITSKSRLNIKKVNQKLLFRHKSLLTASVGRDFVIIHFLFVHLFLYLCVYNHVLLVGFKCRFHNPHNSQCLFGRYLKLLFTLNGIYELIIDYGKIILRILRHR